METRPTSDRLRETVFNILAVRIPGCRFVDLYAGTGAVGIEAISRGAAFVWFAENAAPALKTLRKNLTTLKISNGYALEDRGVGALLQQLGKSTETIDLVYLDPPYEAEDEYTETLRFLGSAAGARLLSPHALVVAEHATRSKFALPERFGALSRTRVYRQGDASLTFYGASPIIED